MRAAASFLFAASVACGSAEPRLSPDRGSVRGGDEVRIEGEGFAGHGALVVTFGGVSARAVVIESDRLVRVKTPPVPGPDPVDVTLSFADGTLVELPGSYAFEEGQAVVIRPEG